VKLSPLATPREPVDSYKPSVTTRPSKKESTPPINLQLRPAESPDSTSRLRWQALFRRNWSGYSALPRRLCKSPVLQGFSANNHRGWGQLQSGNSSRLAHGIAKVRNDSRKATPEWGGSDKHYPEMTQLSSVLPHTGYLSVCADRFRRAGFKVLELSCWFERQCKRHAAGDNKPRPQTAIPPVPESNAPRCRAQQSRPLRSATTGRLAYQAFFEALPGMSEHAGNDIGARASRAIILLAHRQAADHTANATPTTVVCGYYSAVIRKLHRGPLRSPALTDFVKAL
jgi:hypothetical protein